MRSEQDDQAYLWDMLDAALAVQDFIRAKNALREILPWETA